MGHELEMIIQQILKAVFVNLRRRSGGRESTSLFLTLQLHHCSFPSRQHAWSIGLGIHPHRRKPTSLLSCSNYLSTHEMEWLNISLEHGGGVRPVSQF